MGEVKVGGSSVGVGNRGRFVELEREALARDGMPGIAVRGAEAAVKQGGSGGEIHVYLNSDRARREAVGFQMTPELRQQMEDLQLGRVAGIRLGAQNDREVVKFLQAVAGLPQTGVMDRALEAFVRRVQSEARIDVNSGEVLTSGADRRGGNGHEDSSNLKAFKVDGIVKMSIRAFIVKAEELGVLTQQEVSDLLQPFSNQIKAHLSSFVEGVTREVGGRVSALSKSTKRRWDQLCKNDGIEIEIPGIISFVNKRWKEFGLSGEIDELGAKRILAALKTIYRAESRNLGYSAANPGSSARGRYQFMPATIRECRKAGIIGRRERFPACATAEDRIKQDCVAIWLMGSEEKGRRVLDNIVRGDVHGALEHLSWEWAGLPASNGKSRYHGKAGNKARISYHNAVAMMTVNA